MRRPASLIMIDLVASLEAITAIMKLDPQCEWGAEFEDFLRRGKTIVKNGSNEIPVRELCVSIRSIFSGKSPFNEYSPMSFDPKTGRYTPIPGTEDYGAVIKRVYDLSEEIRTIGSY